MFNSSPPSAADMHASVNWVNIGSDNGLSPVWCQAIIWTNAGLLPNGTNLVKFETKYKFFINENTS